VCVCAERVREMVEGRNKFTSFAHVAPQSGRVTLRPRWLDVDSVISTRPQRKGEIFEACVCWSLPHLSYTTTTTTTSTNTDRTRRSWAWRAFCSWHATKPQVDLLQSNGCNIIAIRRRPSKRDPCPAAAAIHHTPHTTTTMAATTREKTAHIQSSCSSIPPATPHCLQTTGISPA